jgi:hypothetical protein
MTKTTHHAANWPEAEQIVRQIAEAAGLRLLLWGTGNPVYKPHVMARSMDAWSGEGYGYSVHVRPQGDGEGAPCAIHTIHVA